ncbi:MAG: hypothetical protein H6972_14195 [Gammaproteobacteria bacterium]|nr:hypothetical protein [Gammaproteobacteria bacterium]
MNEWITGITSSVAGGAIWVFIIWLAKDHVLPRIRGMLLSVPNINATKWDGYSPESPVPDTVNSRLVIQQRGTRIKATAKRRTRNGERSFTYKGVFIGGQLVLEFEEPEGRGYILGSMVLHLSSKRDRLNGRSTYFHHDSGEVISTAIKFKRVKP